MASCYDKYARSVTSLNTTKRVHKSQTILRTNAINNSIRSSSTPRSVTRTASQKNTPAAKASKHKQCSSYSVINHSINSRTVRLLHNNEEYLPVNQSKNLSPADCRPFYFIDAMSSSPAVVERHGRTINEYGEDRDGGRETSQERSDRVQQLSSLVDERRAVYPPSQPFINTDFRRDPHRPVIAYPENNRQAVLSALKNLQDKIRQLEMDRRRETAEIRGLNENGAGSSNGVMRHPPEARIDPNMSSYRVNDTTIASDVFTQLETASRRCELLDRQLEYMRDLVRQAEIGRGHVQHQTKLLRHGQDEERQDEERHAPRTSAGQSRMGAGNLIDTEEQMNKIKELEREQLHLAATQDLAENKIRELKEQLAEERRQRELIQLRAAEMQESSLPACRLSHKETLESQRGWRSTGETDMLHHRDLSEDVDDDVPVRDDQDHGDHGQRSTGSKRLTTNTMPKNRRRGGKGSRPGSGTVNKNVGRKYPTATASCPTNGRGSKIIGAEPPEHFRLRLSDIPFINGKSVGPSHSLNANFQEVLSLMKSHNPRLCKSPLVSSMTRVRQGSSDDDTGTAVRQREEGALWPSTGSCYGERTGRDGTVESGRKAMAEDLESLLLQLQDELVQLGFEHESLMHQISVQRSSRDDAHEDLIRRGDSLRARMKSKEEQITLVRKYQQAADTTRRKRSGARSTKSSSAIGRASFKSQETGHAEVKSTTGLRLGGTTCSAATTPPGNHRSQSSLTLLKDLRKIQTTLRCDDVTWD